MSQLCNSSAEEPRDDPHSNAEEPNATMTLDSVHLADIGPPSIGLSALIPIPLSEAMGFQQPGEPLVLIRHIFACAVRPLPEGMMQNTPTSAAARIEASRSGRLAMFIVPRPDGSSRPPLRSSDSVILVPRTDAPQASSPQSSLPPQQPLPLQQNSQGQQAHAQSPDQRPNVSPTAPPVLDNDVSPPSNTPSSGSEENNRDSMLPDNDRPPNTALPLTRAQVEGYLRRLSDQSPSLRYRDMPYELRIIFPPPRPCSEVPTWTPPPTLFWTAIHALRREAA